ncbi:hypothetical protein AcW1_003028 [Taiwanofungus camphoratus]|nr:hypothetical protein AcW1_003028 [Antrodia cinnamomea]
MVSITSFSSKMSSTTSKVWFSTPTCHLSAPTTNSPIRAVTGALSGFGLAMTRHVLDNGGIAVATLRWPEVLADLTAQYSKDRLLVLKLDVTKPQGVVGEDQRGVRLARCRLQQCGVRPHWRGRRDARRRRPREAVKFFREVSKPGVGSRLMQNSSAAGFVGVTSVRLYSAAKHGKCHYPVLIQANLVNTSALEAVGEAVSEELDPA